MNILHEKFRNSILSEKNIKGDYSVFKLISLWIICAIVYMLLKQQSTTIIYAGFLACIGQVGLDIVIASLTFLLWKRTTGEGKIIFAFSSVSFLLAAITDLNYNVIINILGIVKK
jgi:hypothetical protein